MFFLRSRSSASRTTTITEVEESYFVCDILRRAHTSITTWHALTVVNFPIGFK